MKQQLLIVDAYNMIGNWPELNHLKQTDRLPQARDELISMLTEYKKITGLNISLVFDAMYVPGNSKSYRQADLEIIWTSKDQTADSYIEKYAAEKQSRVLQVTVATSDQAEQWVIFSEGGPTCAGLRITQTGPYSTEGSPSYSCSDARLRVGAQITLERSPVDSTRSISSAVGTQSRQTSP